MINCIDITEINKEDYQFLRNAVSEERRKKADRFHFMKDSIRSICAELLLQYSLFQTKGQVADVVVKYNEYGKPYLSHRKDFLYNLSHSGKWVVIAYGSSEVGIDIEEIQSGKEDIADRFFMEEENNYIHGVTGKERTKRFTQVWTLKESYIKYLGTGLSTSLYSFQVNAVDGVVCKQNGEIQEDLRLKSYPFGEDYFLSVCSVEEDVVIHRIKLEDIIEFINRKDVNPILTRILT